MNLQQRLVLLEQLGQYILSGNENWQRAKEKSSYENGWFTPEFIEIQAQHIGNEYLQKDKLETFAGLYPIPEQQKSPANVGIVMAGNIPMVGFHDFVCCFLSGHRQTIKPSSKDFTLIQHLVKQLNSWNKETDKFISFTDLPKGCAAYIATGSNHSARYFDYYFSKYPSIIRRNRTSVAILTGNETIDELENLANDVYLYFGLGCRNVTKIYVPANFEFFPLLESFKVYNHLIENHKYKNNFDYQLAILIINKLYYMTNGSLILQENNSVFSPISRLHYEFYNNEKEVVVSLRENKDIQCIVGNGYIPFGKSQYPFLADFADQKDTLQFLLNL